MPFIDKIGTKTFRKTETSIDRNSIFVDGFINDFGPSSPSGQTIADIITASGVITLSRTYVPGRNALRVVIDGIEMVDEGPSLANNDYVEINDQQIQLGTDVVADLDPASSNIRIRWNRPIPGVRDLFFADLKNITQDVEDAVLDTNTVRLNPIDATNPLVARDDLFLSNLTDVSTDEADAFNDPSVLRAALADATNPLATLEDTKAGQLLDSTASATISNAAISPFVTFTWPAESKRLRIRVDTAIGDIVQGMGEHTIDIDAGEITGYAIGGESTGGGGTGFTQTTHSSTAIAGGESLDEVRATIGSWSPGTDTITIDLSSSVESSGDLVTGVTVEAFG